MPYSSSGTFNPLITFVDDTPATAEDQNSQDVDIAGGLTECLTRSGLAPATANISFGGFQITNVGPGVAPTDAANLSQITPLAPLASPALTGTPTAPTASPGTNTTQIATTAFVEELLVSPALTGTPTAPTASPGTNTAQIATTAFADAAATAAALVAVPAQTGEAGSVLTTNGSATSWSPMAVTAQAGLVTVAAAAPTLTFSRGISIVRSGVGLWGVNIAGLNNANFTVSITSASSAASGTSLVPVILSKTTGAIGLEWVNQDNNASEDPTAGLLIDITVFGGL